MDSHDFKYKLLKPTSRNYCFSSCYFPKASLTHNAVMFKGVSVSLFLARSDGHSDSKTIQLVL